MTCTRPLCFPLLCTNHFAIILGQKTIRDKIKLIQCRAALVPRKVTKLSGSQEICCCLFNCAGLQVCACVCMRVCESSNYDTQGYSRWSRREKGQTWKTQLKVNIYQGEINPARMKTNITGILHLIYSFTYMFCIMSTVDYIYSCLWRLEGVFIVCCSDNCCSNEQL